MPFSPSLHWCWQLPLLLVHVSWATMDKYFEQNEKKKSEKAGYSKHGLQNADHWMWIGLLVFDGNIVQSCIEDLYQY